MVVEEEALLRVERWDRAHVFRVELYIEDVEVLDDPFLPHRLLECRQLLSVSATAGFNWHRNS